METLKGPDVILMTDVNLQRLKNDFLDIDLLIWLYLFTILIKFDSYY